MATRLPAPLALHGLRLQHRSLQHRRQWQHHKWLPRLSQRLLLMHRQRQQW
jgi:hypothetical protein